MGKKQWLKEVRLYLNEDYTQHLYKRSLQTKDTTVLVALVKRAKGIWAAAISEADQLVNQSKLL